MVPHQGGVITRWFRFTDRVYGANWPPQKKFLKLTFEHQQFVKAYGERPMLESSDLILYRKPIYTIKSNDKTKLY